MNSWVYLAIAVLFEASWVIGLRFTEGWTRVFPSVFVVVAYGAGLIPLSLAGRTISPSVLYAVWVGGGIVTVFLADTFYFGEPAPLSKIFCIFLILSGAVGLKFLTGGH